MLFDVDLSIVGCNPAYLAAVGRTREDLLGRYLFDAFPAREDGISYKLLKGSLDKVLETRRADHIAIIPYDTSRTGEPPALRYWSATHTPVFDHEGTLRYVLQHTVDITELQVLREKGQRENIAEAGLLRRAHEVQAANMAMLVETRLLREMFQKAPGFTGIVVGPEHRFVLANEAFVRLVGGRSLVGLTVAEALPEIVEQGFVDLLDEVYRTGEPHSGADAPVKLVQPGETAPELHYLDFIYQPMFADDGVVNGIFVQGHDVTAKVEAEQLHVLRQRELGHRLKNQLGVVQAIVAQTLRSAESPTLASQSIAQRLQALAAAHDVLIEGVGRAGLVGEIVERAIAFLEGEHGHRVHVSGQDLEIGSRPALALALLLHELATNAVKHGALSQERGTVSISWGLGGNRNEEFSFTWQEHAGCGIGEPTRTGAGAKLINALAKDIGATASSAFHPSGLQFTLRCDRAMLAQ